jgi:hypothetical protein
MDELKQYKYKIEKDIVERALKDYEEEKLSRDELKNIADFTIQGMEKVNNRVDLTDFLKDLSARWPIFTNIAIIEEGSYKDIVEDEVYSGVLALAQNGKIDNAIKLAKTMTN